MKLLLHTSDLQISESWFWSTNVISSMTNSKQRILLNVYPQEEISIGQHFDGKDQNKLDGQISVIGKNLQLVNFKDIVTSKGEFKLPIWQYSGYVTSSSWLATTQIINLGLSEPFWSYPQEEVLLYHSNGNFYLGVVSAFSSNNLTVDFGEDINVTNDFKLAVPIRTGFTQTSEHEWGNKGVYLKSGLTIKLAPTPNRKVLGPTNVVKYESSYTVPIFERRHSEITFRFKNEYGLEIQESPNAFPHTETFWKEPSFEFSYSIIEKRKDLIPYIKAFFEVVKSTKGFWLPSRNDEFEILANLGNAGVLIKGRQFFDFWNESNLKALCTQLGEQIDVVRVLDCTLNIDGDSLATFSKTVPFNFDSVSLCFYVRLKDKLAFTHTQLYTECKFDLESIQINYYLQDLPEPIIWFDSSEPASQISEDEFVNVPNKGTLVPGSLFTGDARPDLDLWVGKPAPFFDNLKAFRWNADLNWLDEPNFSVCFRYETTQVQTTKCLIKAGSDYEIYVSGTSLIFKRGGRVITVTGSPISISTKYTIQHICKNQIDEAYINGVLVGSSASAVGSIDILVNLTISDSTNLRAASGKIPEVRIYNIPLGDSQRNVVRGELEYNWPEESTVAFIVDGSSNTAVFESNKYDRINVVGSSGGYVYSGVLGRPSIAPSNGLIGPYFKGSSPTNAMRHSKNGLGVDFVYKNITNWLISIAVQIGNNTTNVFAINPYFYIKVTGADVTVTLNLSSGTFTNVTSHALLGRKGVLEVEYTAGLSPTIKVRFDNVQIVSFIPTGTVVFNTADPASLQLLGDDIAIFEIRIRKDHVSQYDELVEKWFGEDFGSLIPTNVILDENGDPWTDELGQFITES